MTYELLNKIGRGVCDAEVFAEILTRAGLPVVTPPEDWELGTLVHMMDYVPKNKPFLIGDPTMPSETQGLLEVSTLAKLNARWLLRKFAPCLDPRYANTSGNTIGGCFGCKTDNIEDFGYVYSSKMAMGGFVEGIVSSLANWRIYAMGIKHYEWTPEFLTADFEQMFDHPLRPAEGVPAGNVIHTVSCSANLLEWYLRLRDANIGVPGDAYRLNQWKQRIDVGITQLDAILPYTTEAGAVLVGGIKAWGAELIEEAA